MIYKHGKIINKICGYYKNPESIKYHFEKAYFLSTDGRPGPVWLDIPANIQNAQVDPKKLVGFKIKEKD